MKRSNEALEQLLAALTAERASLRDDLRQMTEERDSLHTCLVMYQRRDSCVRDMTHEYETWRIHIVKRSVTRCTLALSRIRDVTHILET